MYAESVTVDAWGYLAGSLVLLAIWGLIFARRRDLRARMLVLGILLVPLTLLGQSYYLGDYWHPPLMLPIHDATYMYGDVSDYVFVFAFAGVSAALYPVVSQRSPVHAAYRRHRILLLAFVGIVAACVMGLTDARHVNSILSSSLGFLLAGLTIVAVRRDLWAPAVVSGLLAGLLLTAGEGVLSLVAPLYVSRYWVLYHTPLGILIFGRVPLTEALWGTTFGMAIGPLYDACEGSAPVARRFAKAALPPAEDEKLAPQRQ